MSDIVAERSGNLLSIQLNRPAKKNAMTSSMYITMAELLNGAAKDDQICVVLWHAAGNSFSAGNDIEDFMKNPPAPGRKSSGAIDARLDQFRETAGRRRTRRRHWGRNDHVGALRLRIRKKPRSSNCLS